jgi:hypothetical protein
MPNPDDETTEVATAAEAAAEENSWAVYDAERERRRAERQARLRRDAQASWRAMDGWARVETLEDWQEAVRTAEADYDGGMFLLERLGGERYLDPTLMAVLLTLRRRLIDEHGAETAAELMLVDCAVLSYYHTLRINGWIGDASRWLESQFFGQESLTATLPYGQEVREARGLTIEYIVEQVVQKLMPLVDRSNRMMIRNLKALRALREPPAPSVSIGTAGQVNVAAKQVNTADGLRASTDESDEV